MEAMKNEMLAGRGKITVQRKTLFLYSHVEGRSKHDGGRLSVTETADM